MKHIEAVVVLLRIMHDLPERRPILNAGRPSSAVMFTQSYRHSSRQSAFPGGNMMRPFILSIVAAAALVPLFVGCSSQRAQVARGQAPAGQNVTAYGEEICDEDGYALSSRRHLCRHCGGRGCCYCRPYHVPRDLSYPPEAGLPATVQYPYYTCKGPDCFFLDNDHSR
jgi:hypothetical protein